MKVNWNDQSVFDFLHDFGLHSDRQDKICRAVIKRLQFKEIDIDDIVTKEEPYDIYPKRVLYYQRKYQKGEKIGTLFCRSQDTKWFVKDGNHRYLALKHSGVTKFRIAFDIKNRI